MSKKNGTANRETQKSGATRTSRTQKSSTTTHSFSQIAATMICEADLTNEQRGICRALLGVEGFCKRPLGCDETVRRGLKPHLLATIRRETAGSFAEWTLVKIEVSDDCGLSSITAPQLHIKGVTDRALKMMKGAGIEGISTIRVQPYREDTPGDATKMAIRSLTLGFVPPGVTPAEVKSRLRQHMTVAVTRVPNLRVTPIGADELEAEINLFLKLPTKTLTLAVTEQGARRWSQTTNMTNADIWAAFEASAEISPSYLMIGVGSRGRAWAADLKGKVSATQRARVEKGMVLQKEHDTWASLATLRAALGITTLGVRSDVPIKRPPAVPKPKSHAQVKNILNKKGRMSDRHKLPIAPVNNT